MRCVFWGCLLATLPLAGCSGDSSSGGASGSGSSGLPLGKADAEILTAVTDAMWVADNAGCIVLTADASTDAGFLAVWPSGTTLTADGEVLLPQGQVLSPEVWYRFGGGGVEGWYRDIDRAAMTGPALDCLDAYGGGWLVGQVTPCDRPDCPDLLVPPSTGLEP